MLLPRRMGTSFASPAGRLSYMLFCGLSVFQHALPEFHQKIIRNSSEFHQNSPEFTRGSPECYRNFARISPESRIGAPYTKKGDKPQLSPFPQRRLSRASGSRSRSSRPRRAGWPRSRRPSSPWSGCLLFIVVCFLGCVESNICYLSACML